MLANHSSRISQVENQIDELEDILQVHSDKER